MSEPAKDPRFRPFRAASWALYLVVSVGFSSLIVVSVYWSVLRMTPERPAGVTERYGEQECVDRSRALFDELEQQRRAQSEGPDTRRGDQRFLKFRVEWLGRKVALEARCAPEERPRLKPIFASLDRLLDLYTTGSVQFSGTTGPTIDALRKQLDGTP